MISRTRTLMVVANVALVAACAQLQGIDSFEKVDCLDDCADAGAPPTVPPATPPIDNSRDAEPSEGGDLPVCANGKQDPGESDVDCGGSCPKCPLGKSCTGAADCDSALCVANTCTIASCTDGVKSPGETDLDCGGTSCPKCINGKACVADADCTSGACDATCIPKPALLSITPIYGGTAGGTAVVFNGQNFVDKPGWTARIGNLSAGGVFASATSVSGVAPAGSIGTVDVSILGMPGGTMTLTQAFTYVNLDIVFAAAQTVGYAPAGSVGVGDMSGDAKLDYIQDHSGGHFDLGLSTSTTTAISFTNVTSIPAATPRRTLMVDLDGDAKADLIETETANFIGVHISTGANFNVRTDYATAAGPEGVVAVDFNGDTKADIAVIHTGADVVDIFINNGNGTFAAAVPITVPRGTRIVTADLNADGYKDLVISASVNAQVNVLLGNGNGTFKAATPYTVPGPSEGVAIADVDFDGKLDIIAANGGRLSTLRGKGDGTFNPAVGTTITGATSIPVIAAADLNGDSRADVVLLNVALGQAEIWAAVAGGSFVPTGKVFAMTAPTDLALADFSGDGKLDLIYTGSAGVRVHLRQ